MFTPEPEDVHMYVEAPAEACLAADTCWMLNKAMNGLRVSSSLFQNHLASILRSGGFEGSAAEKCLHKRGDKDVLQTPGMEQAGQIYLGASFSRLHMMIDGVSKNVIVEGSKPGCFQNSLIQAGKEKGSAVGTAGIQQGTAEDDDEFISEEDHSLLIQIGVRKIIIRITYRRPDFFTSKEEV
eukprot:4602835-Amphidinium_carterae.2